MGNQYAHPISLNADTGGFVSMTLRMPDKFRVLHAPPNVVDMVQRVATEVCGQQLYVKDKYGAFQIKFPGRPFCLNVGKDTSTVGKLFATRVLEEMYALGYDFVTSSDLARMYDLSSWYFVKVQPERTKQRVICVAPGGFDKIVTVNASAGEIEMVRRAIVVNWSRGIQNEKTHQTAVGEVFEFKLHGNPWFSSGSEAADCRRIILGVMGHLGRGRWRLITPTSLKGGTDTLFFVYDEKYDCLGPQDFAMISLNRTDRIRLIHFDESMIPVVRESIMRSYLSTPPSEQVYYGTHEFKLKGTPFHTSGDGTVATRTMVCKILEDLSAQGWDLHDCMDVSRKVTDKSVFIFKRSERRNLSYACVCLTDVDHLRLINFPPHVKEILRQIVLQWYMPGVTKEQERDSHCHKMYMAGYPWGHSNSYSIHARSMLTSLLRAAAQQGWYLRGSADVSAKYCHQENGPDYPLDVHSWFFCNYNNS